jgi:hypothetical protein
MSARLRSVPSREWLAVLLPPLFGLILLVAGAVATARADAWLAYAAAAVVGAALPLMYTLRLARENRLILRSDAAIARSRSRLAMLIPLGWLLGAAGLALLYAVSGAGRAVFYGALGGAAFGIWPGLLANFVRLWREEWAPGAMSPASPLPSRSPSSGRGRPRRDEAGGR